MKALGQNQMVGIMSRRQGMAIGAGMSAWALLLALIALAVGGFSISAVEPPPDGAFYDCGPAVFGRLAPLPHPHCAHEMAHLVADTWVLFAVSGLLLVAGMSLLLLSLCGRLDRSASPRFPHPRRLLWLLLGPGSAAIGGLALVAVVVSGWSTNAT